MGELTATLNELDRVSVISIEGDLDGNAAEQLSAVVSEAIDSNPVRVVLDLAGLGFMNSSGIAAVVGILRQARAAGVELAATGLSDHYRHIFHITRLDQEIAVYPDISDATAR